jgi:hypothetical protein
VPLDARLLLARSEPLRRALHCFCCCLPPRISSGRGFLPLVSAIAVAHRRVLLHRHRVRELGFGDITAMRRRLASWVTGRMVAGIVIVGIGASIIVDAIKQGRRQQPTQGGDAGPNANGPPE